MIDYLSHMIVDIIDLSIVLILFFSFCYAIFEYLLYYGTRTDKRIKKLIKKFWKPLSLEQNRLKLAENLLFALEVLICADIILSVIEPSMEHLTQLAIIVWIRIVISHFLQKEVDEIERLEKHHGNWPTREE